MRSSSGGSLPRAGNRGPREHAGRKRGGRIMSAELEPEAGKQNWPPGGKAGFRLRIEMEIMQGVLTTLVDLLTDLQGRVERLEFDRGIGEEEDGKRRRPWTDDTD
jgi:hypothetical protein